MFDAVLNAIDDVVWGIPTIVLILATGLILTIRSRGLQFTKLGRAFRSIFKENEGHGELCGFSALCTALSATIGTGNIVGVATAIAAGGPGALFWMWVAAILGTATKFSECMLAIKYREVKADGHVLGGPFYTIEKGMGKNWKWLAMLFAIFGVLAGLLGIGTMTQINGITSAVNMAFDPDSAHIAFTIGETAYTWATVIGGIVVTVCAALVILGGLQRISKVAEKTVPAMAIIYVFLGLSVIIMNATRIPAAFALIFKSAFGFKAVVGGAVGWTVKQIADSMQKGIARGIFSN
ncbi:MAG: alanine:cation symporter family protein, partial [Treponemataceae bacterium]|nr:alanine:cation symporter family protein [Treponemataceae bacterium]